MNILCTYATPNMTNAADKLIAGCGRHGIDQAYMWTPADLGEDFKAFNRDTLSQQRGAGYWLWKPYIILKTLLQATTGDIVMYSDAGLQMNAHIDHLIASMAQDEILLFGNTHKQLQYCKQSCIDMMGTHVEEDQEQVQATVILFRVSQYTIDFVTEWLLWCEFKYMIDDTVMAKPERDDFIEHRHDQAILTNMAISHGIKLHWWAAQYNHGNHVRYDDQYPFPMFIHEGQRNDGSRHTHEATIKD